LAGEGFKIGERGKERAGGGERERGLG